MKIVDLRICNFKSIRDMRIADIENALILVGKNNTGKTAVLDAVRAVSGDYEIREEDFREDKSNIEIEVALEIDGEDLRRLHRKGAVSAYRGYESWYKDFLQEASVVSGWETYFLLHCKPEREEQIRGWLPEE